MVTDATTRWKRPESVLVLVYATGGEVLLLQRADDPAFWQSVTGSLEGNETPLETARRELREETGLEREPQDRGECTRFEIRGLWRARYAPGVTHNVEHVFTVRLDAPCDVTLAPDEHLAWRWVDAADAMALTGSDTNARAIRDVVIDGIASPDLVAPDGLEDSDGAEGADGTHAMGVHDSEVQHGTAGGNRSLGTDGGRRS